MKCLICEKAEAVKFLDEYKLEIKTDIKFFSGLKIYKCEDCDFSFVSPMPTNEKLNYFYKHVYRAPGRPPYWTTGNYEDLKKHYLEDKNLNYLLYLSTLVDFSKIKNLYDFGGGYGDLGYLLKKKFPHLELFCTENDENCKNILNKRSYKNFEKLEDINTKFDMIITTHSLEHLTDTSIFFKFNNILKPNGLVFFEIPNCPKEYFNGRPYDSPHLLFYTRKSMNKIAKIHNMEFINFSYSSYSFDTDHRYQRESQNLYKKQNSSKFLFPVKKLIKKIMPSFLINLRRNYLESKNLLSEERSNLFVNNTGNNCYIRGILIKK